MTKSELIQRLGKDAGISQSQAGRLVNDVFDVISEALQSGDEVRITGFGTFRVVDTKERVGRNPRTGEELVIPPGKRVSFSPGTGLLETVKGGDRNQAA